MTPCGVCDSCTSIAAASSLDVIEMDAASSNSVDDIRALRESVAYAPVSGRQKVYILDEAHMLSTAAWNAFLKTLEEPPPNTVFVLATTEAQKVLPTVVDRCHRFDFQRPTRRADRDRARPRRARGVDRRRPGGGRRAGAPRRRQLPRRARDARAAADLRRVARSRSPTCSPCSASPTPSSCSARSTRSPPSEPRAALRAIAEAVDGGRDPAAFIRELEAHARELLIVQMQDGAVPAELRLTPERDERLAEQAVSVPPATLVRTLDLLADALTHLRAGADARTQLELALIRAARPDLDPTSRALAARVEALEGGRAHRRARGPRRPSERRRRRAAARGRAPRGSRRRRAAVAGARAAARRSRWPPT